MAKELNEAARALGSKGGKQRAKNLTAEQRREIGRKGAEARWKQLDQQIDDDLDKTMNDLSADRISGKEARKRLAEIDKKLKQFRAALRGQGGQK